MPSIPERPEPDGEQPSAGPEASQESLAASLDEILRLLNQMQMLAELSAGSLNVNRPLLQKNLEVLRKKIDRIADRL